jgi:ERF superfamily
MARSEQINELIAALAKARPHFKSIPKAATNKYGGYDYATLEDILEAITPALAEQGLVPYFDTAYDDDHHETGVETYLFHTSGQWISTLIWLGTPEVETKANTALSVPQRIGVALTYGRKYGICMVAAVQPGGEDDDAQSDLSKPTHAESQPLARGPAKAARGWPTDGSHTSPETMTQAGIDPAEQKSIERHEAKENRAQGIMPPTVRASDPTWLNPEAAFAAIQQRLSVLAGSHEETQVMPYVQLAWGTGMTSLSQLSRQGKSSLNRGLARLNAMPVPGDDRSPVGDPPGDPSGRASSSVNGAPGQTSVEGSPQRFARRIEEPLAKDMRYNDDGFLIPEDQDWLRSWAEQSFCGDVVDAEKQRHGGINEAGYGHIKAEVYRRQHARAEP